MTAPSTQRVSNRFVELLRARLGSERFLEMQRRNVAEERDSVCHSHDFLDANEIMAEALRDVVGVAPFDSGISQARSDALMVTFNEAWSLAAPILRTLPAEHALRLADAFALEVLDLYMSGILEEPDADDPDDPWRPLSEAVEAYVAARGGADRLERKGTRYEGAVL